MSLFLLSCGTASGIYKNPVVEAQTSKAQYSRIIFCNSSKLGLYPTSGAIGIGIIIDGKYVTKLRWSRYIEVYVQKGQHELELYHWDVFKFTSRHKLEISEDFHVIELYCTPVSNAYVIKNELPPNFELDYVKVDF
jgi:hypothetical protein